MWIICLLGFHRRSRGQARYEVSRYVSQCARCGILMEKKRGGWVVLKKPK